MKVDSKTKWQKVDPNNFKSGVQTRSQFRAQFLQQGNKKLKPIPETESNPIDFGKIDENTQKIIDSESKARISNIEFLNKFATKRLGMAAMGDLAMKSAQKLMNEEEDAEIMTAVENEKFLSPAKISSESKPAGETDNPFLVHVHPVKIEDAPLAKHLPVEFISPKKPPLQTPSLDETLLDQHIAKLAFDLKRVADELSSKSTEVPHFNLGEKYKYTKEMVRQNKVKTKIDRVVEILIDNGEIEFEKIKKMDIYSFPEFRILFDAFEEFYRKNYALKQEEVIARVRIPIQKHNQKNTYIRQRLPVVTELNSAFKKMEKELTDIEDNKIIDYDKIKNELQSEFQQLKIESNCYFSDQDLEEEFDTRKIEFINRNMKGFYEASQKIAEAFEKLEVASQNFDWLDENNRINHKNLYNREYSDVDEIIEGNGIELMQNFIESYPGRYEIKD